MKAIRNIFIAVLIFSFVFSFNSFCKEESCSWYIKKNGNKRPEFPENSAELSEYNCIFVDDITAAKGEKRLYLTFDAGYENGNVEKILDILQRENIPAAFFLLDNIILKNKDLVKRMVDEGHLVCNHTKNHKNLSCSSKDEIMSDLSALESIYTEKTGREMSKFFRFPEGKYSLEAVKSINELGYTTVFWSMCYDDWDNSRQMDKTKAMNKLLKHTHDGAVILLHPTSKTNVEILPELIKEWRNMGYSFYSLENFGK